MAGINGSMAHLSDGVFTTAIAAYAAAMVAYTAEYAFGRRGRVATTAEAKVLVGAGGPDVGAGGRFPRAAESTRRTGADRAGRVAVALALLGVTLHSTSIAIRGIASISVPWRYI